MQTPRFERMMSMIAATDKSFKAAHPLAAHPLHESVSGQEPEKTPEMQENELEESSLSRVHGQMEDYDIAMLSAFRGMMENCLDDSMCTGLPVAKPENLARNSRLLADLRGMGYGVTAIDGSYIEGFGEPGQREVRENSFFVVNLKDDPAFRENITSLGKKYCQDSVIVKLKGQAPQLIGTNNAGFPGLGQEHQQGDFVGGEIAQFMSRVRNRPFHFKPYGEDLNEDKYSKLLRHLGIAG